MAQKSPTWEGPGTPATLPMGGAAGPYTGVAQQNFASDLAKLAAANPSPSQTLSNLLGPFMYSLDQQAQQASPSTNPQMKAMMAGLAPQYQQALAPSMAQYSANVASLPGLVQGAVNDVGKASMLGDLLKSLEYEFVYQGKQPSQTLGTMNGLLSYILGNQGSAASPSPGPALVPVAPPTSGNNAGWGGSTSYSG